MHAPIVYGLLAHSHSWKGDNSTPEDNIEQKLRESDKLHVSHPRQTLDLLCVADLGTWISGKLGPVRARNHLLGGAHSCYVQHTPSHQNQTKYFTAIGTLISNLSRRLAWEEPALRDIVDYYQFTNIGGTGEGVFRKWPISIYSENVQRSIQSGVFGASSSITTWNEWQVGYNL